MKEITPETSTTGQVKRRKPDASFPLRVHRNGQWFTTKRIGGFKEFFYFGKVADDPNGDRAFQAWLEVAEQLRAGRRPVGRAAVAGGVSCQEIADRFTSYTQARYNGGEIKCREFGDVRLACMGHFLDAVGEKTVGDGLDRSMIVEGRADPVTPLQLLREHLLKRMGAYAFHRNLDKIRRMLKWARKHELLPREMHEDDALKRLPKRLVRREVRARAERNGGQPVYTAEDVIKLVVAAAAAALRGSPMLAMVLLGLNGGCDAAWLSDAPLDAFDLDRGFVDWVRPKTEELCRFPIWPITVEAIRQWLPNRPRPRFQGDAGRIFLTVRGNRFVREVVKTEADGTITEVNPDDAAGKEFVKIEKAAGITKRRGRNFKALRRTHATAANDITDADARRMIMGHGLMGMDPHYVRGLFPATRLRIVTDHVGLVLLGTVDTACAYPRNSSTADLR